METRSAMPSLHSVSDSSMSLKFWSMFCVCMIYCLFQGSKGRNGYQGGASNKTRHKPYLKSEKIHKIISNLLQSKNILKVKTIHKM